MQELYQWINQNSGSLNHQGLEAMSTLLEASFSTLPVTSQRISLSPYKDLDGETVHPGPALQFTWNPEAAHRVFLSGHMDTVYGPDSPFQSWDQTAPDRLQGPGAADMKGGLYVMLQALRQFHQTSQANAIGYEILITSDEEIGSHASRSIIESVAKTCTSGLVFESALPSGELVRNRKGNGSFRFSVTGKAAHTGRDFEAGRSAIVAIAHLISRLHHLNEVHPEAIINVGRMSGGGALNVVPESASCFINIRISSPQVAEEIKQSLKELTQNFSQETGCELEWSGEFSRPSKVHTEGNEALFQRYRTTALDLNQIAPGHRDTGGASDGNFLAGIGLPHLDGVGAIGGNIHSTEEFIIPSALEPRIALTCAYLQSLADNPLS